MGSCASSPGAAAPIGPPVKVVKAPSPSSRQAPRRKPVSRDSRGPRHRETPKEPRPKRRKSVRSGQGDEDEGSSSHPEQYPNQPQQQSPGSGETEETGLSEIELARKRIHQLCQGKARKPPKYQYHGKANSVPSREQVRLWLMVREHDANQSSASGSHGRPVKEVTTTTYDDSDNDDIDSYAAFEQWRKSQPQLAQAELNEVEEFDQFYSWKRNRIVQRQRQQAYEEFMSWERGNQQSRPPIDERAFEEVVPWQRAAQSTGISQSVDDFVTWQRNSGRSQTATSLSGHDLDAIISWQRSKPEAQNYEDFVTWQRNNHVPLPMLPELFHQAMQREETNDDQSTEDSSIRPDVFEEVVRWQRSKTKLSVKNSESAFDDFVTWQRQDPAAKTTGVLKVEADVFEEVISWQRSQPELSDAHKYDVFANRVSLASSVPPEVAERVHTWQRHRPETPELRAFEIPDGLDVYLEYKGATSSEPQSSGSDLAPDYVDSYVEWKRNNFAQVSASKSLNNNTLPTFANETDDLDIFVEWSRANRKSKISASKTDAGADDLVEYVTWRHNRTKAKIVGERGKDISADVSFPSAIADDELLTYLSWERSRATSRRIHRDFERSAGERSDYFSDELLEYVQWKRSGQVGALSKAPESISDEDEALRYVLWQRKRAKSASPRANDHDHQSNTKVSPDNELLEYIRWQRSRRTDFLSRRKHTARGAGGGETDLSEYLDWKRSKTPALQPKSPLADRTVKEQAVNDDVDEYLAWKRTTDNRRGSASKQTSDDEGMPLLNESLSSTRKKKKKGRSTGSIVSDISVSSFSASDMKESMLSCDETQGFQSSRFEGGDVDEDARSWLEESLSSMSKKRKKKKKKEENSIPAANAEGVLSLAVNDDDADADQVAWLNQSLSSLSKKRKKKRHARNILIPEDSNIDPTSDDVLDSLMVAVSSVEMTSLEQVANGPTAQEQIEPLKDVNSEDELVSDIKDVADVSAESVDQQIDVPAAEIDRANAHTSKRPATKKKSKSITEGMTEGAIPKSKKKKRASSKVGDGPAIPLPKRWSKPVKKETKKDKFFRLLSLDHRTEAGTKEIQDMILSNPELCQENYSFEGVSDGINPLSRLSMIHAPLEAVMMCYMAYPSAIKQFDQVGTPLHHAAKSATPTDVMSFLISKRPLMVQTLNMERLAPLHYACMSKAAPETIHLLLEHYPSAVQLQDKHGQSPLHLACANGSELGIIEQLVQAFPEACISENHERQTPLHLALISEAPFDVIEALVVSKFDAVKVADEKGNLPLHVAAMTLASKETIQLFIDHYKDGRKAKNREKQRPIDLAQIRRPEDEEILALLTIPAKK